MSERTLFHIFVNSGIPRFNSECITTNERYMLPPTHAAHEAATKRAGDRA